MEALVGMATGPLGALALSVAILWWLANKVVPVMERYLTGQNEKIGKLVSALETTVSEHVKDREAFEDAIATISQRLDKVEQDVDTIKAKVVSHE